MAATIGERIAAIKNGPRENGPRERPRDMPIAAAG